MAEVTVVLKPRAEWRAGLTWDGLIGQMDEKLHFPGMPNVWWMPIQTRTEMLATGVRSPLGIEVFGDDLEAIEKAAIAVEHAVVEGARHAQRVRRALDRRLLHRLRGRSARRPRVTGSRVADVNMVVAQAIGGENVSETVEGRERYPISVRYAREFRDDPELLGRMLIGTPDGAQVPLSQVASIRERARAADDPQRRRQARRLRLRRHGPPDRRLRGRGEAGRRRATCSSRPARASTGSGSSSTSSAPKSG